MVLNVTSVRGRLSLEDREMCSKMCCLPTGARDGSSTAGAVWPPKQEAILFSQNCFRCVRTGMMDREGCE